MTQAKRTQAKQLPILLTAALGLASAALLGTSAVSAQAQQQLTADDAKAIALQDAGLEAGQVRFIKVEADKDNGIPVYEVEFMNNQSEYDYTISALDGSITEKDFDIEEVPGTGQVNQEAQPAAARLTADDAKAIAFRDAGLAEADVTVLKVKADRENNRPVYEIEFKHGRTEYDYTIDAENGSIVDKDVDMKRETGTGQATPAAQPAAASLTADDAKAIAFRDAGLAEADVTVLKVKADKENNRPVYEVEFKHGRTEYDYTIDAENGSIIEKDIDMD